MSTKLIPPKGYDTFPVFKAGGMHSISVSKSGTEVPKDFLKAALLAGCVPQDVGYEDEVSVEYGNDTIVYDAVVAILDRDDPEQLDGTGRPTLKAVKAEAGFNVSRLQLDTAWSKVQDSLV